MLAESFGANLAFFLVGQVVAWLYLRTGLVGRGLFTLILTWMCADLALVLRFGYDQTGLVYVGSLAAMQAVVVFEALRLGIGLGRRRRGEFRARRDAGYRDAMVHLLRDQIDDAVARLRTMVRADPWDMPARLTLGVALARVGRVRAARRQLHSARRLDRAQRYADAIQVELERLGAAAAGPAPEPSPAIEPLPAAAAAEIAEEPR